MRKQVITITVEGTMQGLQVKPGQGLDLRQFGDCKIVRASEIVWDEAEQAWKVDVLQEAGRGLVTRSKLIDALGSEQAAGHLIERHRPVRGWMGLVADLETGDPVVMTSDYDAAVQIEIAYLDGLRQQGVY